MSAVVILTVKVAELSYAYLETDTDISILKRNLYLWGYEKNNSTDGSGTAAGCML